MGYGKTPAEILIEAHERARPGFEKMATEVKSAASKMNEFSRAYSAAQSDYYHNQFMGIVCRKLGIDQP